MSRHTIDRRRSSRAENLKKFSAIQKVTGPINPQFTAPPMSTSANPTPVQESTKVRSNDPHKTKKRKHADDHEKPGTEKKKKHKKLRREDDDSLHAAETPVKKPKKRARSPPVPIEDRPPTSPSQFDIPNATPIVRDNNARETIAADKPTTHHSPSPSILDDSSPSPFHSVRLSLYLPLSAISLSPSTALASLQAEHLSPLLLTYYAPARGTVLAFTDTVLSSGRPASSSPPSSTSTSTPTPILAHCADDYGASYTWLTTTFLVFRPTPGATLSGWINVCSESFVGLLSYNYFQAGVAKSRIPADWRWVGPGGEQDSTQARKRSKRTKIRIRSSESSDDDEGDSTDRAVDVDMDADNSQATQVAPEAWAEDEYDGTGDFVTADGARVDGTLSYCIVDADVVPGHDRDKWSVQIEGTLLRPEDEAALVAEERAQAAKLNARGKRVVPVAMMSGGLGAEDRRRTVSVSQTPVPSSVRR